MQPSTAAGKNICSPISGRRVSICADIPAQRGLRGSLQCCGMEGRSTGIECRLQRTQESSPHDLMMVLRSTTRVQAGQHGPQVSTSTEQRRCTGIAAKSVLVRGHEDGSEPSPAVAQSLVSTPYMMDRDWWPVVDNAGRQCRVLSRSNKREGLTRACAILRNRRPEASPARCPNTATTSQWILAFLLTWFEAWCWHPTEDEAHQPCLVQLDRLEKAQEEQQQQRAASHA